MSDRDGFAESGHTAAAARHDRGAAQGSSAAQDRATTATIAPSPTSWRFDAIGTTWQIDTVLPMTDPVRAAVTARIEEYDATWSRFRDDSLVSSLRATGEHTLRLPPEAAELFALYDALHTITGGAVDPLVGGRLEALGYDAAYSFVDTTASATATETATATATRAPGSGSARPAVDWAAARAGQDPRSVHLTGPAVLDVGAAGKGQLVDLVSAVLAEHGHPLSCVDASGDMLSRGMPQRVALEHPYRPTTAIGIATPGDRALCASATNRRVWGDGLHHVLDGRTGMPVQTVVATWAIADTTMLADGLATALFVASPGSLAEHFDFEYARMFTDGRAQYSRSFPGEFFT